LRFNRDIKENATSIREKIKTQRKKVNKIKKKKGEKNIKQKAKKGNEYKYKAKSQEIKIIKVKISLM